MKDVGAELKEALGQLELLVSSMAEDIDDQALDLLLGKTRQAMESIVRHGRGTWNKMAAKLVDVLQGAGAETLGRSKQQFSRIWREALELLLTEVKQTSRNRKNRFTEEKFCYILERMKSILSGNKPKFMTEEYRKHLDAGKCPYEVDMLLSASADSPDLFTVFNRLAACGEVFYAAASLLNPQMNGFSRKGSSPCFTLQYYLWSDLDVQDLERALQTATRDLPNLRMDVYPVFFEFDGSGTAQGADLLPGFVEDRVSETGSTTASSTSDNRVTAPACPLEQNEEEALKLIIIQLKEYLGLPCYREEFSKRVPSAAQILQNIGNYLNQPGLINKTMELMSTSASEDCWLKELANVETVIRNSTAANIGEKIPNIPSKDQKDKDEETVVSTASYSKTIRVDESKIDYLMTLAGELVVKCNALPYVIRKLEGNCNLPELTREMYEHYTGMNRLVQELQDAVMRIRLLPASHIFQRFPRMVRDLARELGKEVELLIEGEDTEIDKAVIETIGEPLVHLVRNAIDHGLEFPEQRLSLGKKAAGTVILRALREGSIIALEVEDDGQGIDKDKVLKKAIALGLASPEEAESLEEEQIFDFLFVSGFSTAEKVTKVSGRGVGMDAVKATVRDLNGSVKVKTRLGAGTVVRLELPFTLVTSKVLIVEQSGVKYGIPLAEVKEMIKINHADLSSMRNKPVAMIRGELVPVVFLGEFLGTVQKQENKGEELCLVVINEGFALGVDRLIAREDLVLKPFGEELGFNLCFAGAAIMGDGNILLVLNPKRIRSEL